MKRLDLKLHFYCTNNCRFCVQAHKRNIFYKPKEEVFKELEDGRKDGAEELVLTGGEPTLHKDLPEIIEYARELGYKNIQLQTNGRLLASKRYFQKLVDAGLTEVSPALHGHRPELHDFLTRAKNSFKQTVKGILNAKDFGLRIVLNSVVTKPNFRYLPKMAELFVRLDVYSYQFAFVHAAGNAWYLFEQVVPRLSLAAPYIHKGLEIGEEVGIISMAEAMPLCYMQGYERFVSELWYMPKETAIWDATWKIEDYNKVRQVEGKAKAPWCKYCKFYPICEGTWKEYFAHYGFDELKPIPGDYVFDPQELINKNIEEHNKRIIVEYSPRGFRTISQERYNAQKTIL